MNLTDKCKEDFENWLYGKKVETLRNKDSISKKVYTTTHFKNLPFSMQYAVYLDFFDSVGIIISIEHWENYNNSESFGYFKVQINQQDVSDYNDTRLEARMKAIEKANEIYNKTK